MQRALSFEATPEPSIPLRFMLAAPWFAVAAGLLLAWAGGQALESRWSPATLAVTHLMTLGFLGMTMLGAVLQMLPVVAGAPVPHTRAVGLAAWTGLAGGTPLLAGALLKGSPPLFAAAALFLGPGLLAFCAAVLCALARRAPAGALPMVAGMRLALPSFALAALLGLPLAAYLAGGPVLPAIQVTNLHAIFGLLGWVAMLVIAVSFQVIPMFQAAPVYPAWPRRLLPAILGVLLFLWSTTYWRHLHWQRWVGAAIALLLAGYACLTLALLSKSRSKQRDVTAHYWLISMASLAACAVVYASPGIDDDKRAILLGILFIVGFAMSAVTGMLYKIVPFLLWYHLAAAGVARSAVPKVSQWIADRAAWLGMLLAGAALRYRRLLKASALERA